MAWLAVNKNGTELISSCKLFRNGKHKVYMGCYPKYCKTCVKKYDICKEDKDGKRFQIVEYDEPPIMEKSDAIKKLSYWDNYEQIESYYKIDYTVKLPKGSIKKLIGRDLTWEDEPVKYK